MICDEFVILYRHIYKSLLKIGHVLLMYNLVSDDCYVYGKLSLLSNWHSQHHQKKTILDVFFSVMVGICHPLLPSHQMFYDRF